MSERSKKILLAALKCLNQSDVEVDDYSSGCTSNQFLMTPNKDCTETDASQNTSIPLHEYFDLDQPSSSHLHQGTSFQSDKENVSVCTKGTDYDQDDFDSGPETDAINYDSDNDPEYVPVSSSEEDDNLQQGMCDENQEPVHENIIGVDIEENQIIDAARKEKKKRKRMADPRQWEKNKRREHCQSGKEYTSMRGKKVSARCVKDADCSKCPRKCSEHFVQDLRIQINRKYWDIGNIDKQRLYLASLITEGDKKSSRTVNVSRRKKTKNYFLIKNGLKHQVCQNFFLKTFDVSETFIRNIIKKRDEHNIVSPDKRGCHPPGIKRPETSREYIKEHINSFARVPSHYCRKDTEYEYLPADLNVQKMYEAYLDKCNAENITPEKNWFYRQIFRHEFKIKFHVPRKDFCDTCFKFLHSSDVEKSQKQADQDEHITRKRAATKIHDKAKILSLDGDLNFVEFDLEAVRYCPSTNAKAIFYKRRLAVYNLTIYDVPTKRASNYMWHEGIAGRGSNEVSSCLFKYLQQEANGKDFLFMSDTCGGQNRNVNVSAMFLYAVKILNISKIDHCFFEPGHSMMECDSVHARIETASKNIDIFDPSGWYTIVRSASKQSKYHVIEIGQEDVFNFKGFSSNLIKNKKTDTQGNNINWLKITWLQYRKEDEEHIYFKYSKDEPDFRAFKIKMRNQRSQVFCTTLERAYTNSLQIKPEKYKDLMTLCRDGIIPSQYHNFYKSLKEGQAVPNEEDE